MQDFANWGTLTDYILQRPGRQWMELESLVLARVAAEAGLELWTLEQSLQQHDEGGPADRFCGLSARRYMVLLALLRDVAQGLAYLDEQVSCRTGPRCGHVCTPACAGGRGCFCLPKSQLLWWIRIQLQT